MLTPTAPLRDLAAILEKQWDHDLFGSKKGLATMLGWRSYHTLHARGSQPGFPDRTLWKDRLVFAELKRELTGKKSEDQNRRPKPAQVSFLDGLSRAGAEVYLWRPSDEPEIARILSHPWRYFAYRKGSVSFDKPPFLARVTADGTPIAETVWIPRSMWVPGAGRADEAGVA